MARLLWGNPPRQVSGIGAPSAPRCVEAKVGYPSVDAPLQARKNVGVVAARGRMLSSVRPLMRQVDSRRPVWEFAAWAQITQSVPEGIGCHRHRLNRSAAERLGRVTVSAFVQRFSENSREPPSARRYGKIAPLRANDSRMGDKPYQGTRTPPPRLRCPHPLRHPLSPFGDADHPPLSSAWWPRRSAPRHT